MHSLEEDICIIDAFLRQWLNKVRWHPAVKMSNKLSRVHLAISTALASENTAIIKCQFFWFLCRRGPERVIWEDDIACEVEYLCGSFYRHLSKCSPGTLANCKLLMHLVHHKTARGCSALRWSCGHVRQPCTEKG